MKIDRLKNQNYAIKLILCFYLLIGFNVHSKGHYDFFKSMYPSSDKKLIGINKSESKIIADKEGNTSNLVDIKITLKNYQEDAILLAYNFGLKTYIKDTVKLENGVFRYTSTEPIDEAIYKIVLLPKNESIEIIIDKKNHHYSMSLDVNDIVPSATFTNSKCNNNMYDYHRLVQLKTLESKKENSDLEKLKKEVLDYQNKLERENPTSYFTFILKSMKEVIVPEYEDIADENERNLKRFYEYRKDYFKYIDFADDRLVRTSFFESNINNYLDKMTQQTPDSIISAIDLILSKAKKSTENYKFLVIKFLNMYANSKIVCMDAVYTHIGENYYCNPVGFRKPEWIDAAQLTKICENVNDLKPTLCGKIAPDPKFKLLPSSNPLSIKISDVSANYKVLVFWNLGAQINYDLFTALDEMYQTLKSKNVEIISVAAGTAGTSEIERYISNYQVKWVSTIDSNQEARKDFNVENFPAIFILDKNNTIRYKQVSFSQIKDIIMDLTK